jgi:S-adenosylmethionine decarboxylase
VLHSATTALLTEAGFTILGELTHHFEPYGWTGIFLLAESHLALHTFPENNRTYLELASCSEDKYKNFVALLGEAKST